MRLEAGSQDQGVLCALVKARQTAAGLLPVERPRFALMNMMTNLRLEAKSHRDRNIQIDPIHISIQQKNHFSFSNFFKPH